MSPKRDAAVDDHGLDLGQAAGARRSLDHLGRILRPGERILCGATGFLEGRAGLVVATTERFMFVYRDETPIDSEYPAITRFRAKVGIVASDLEIEDGSGVANIRQIHPRSRLADLAGILQRGPGDQPATPPLPKVASALPLAAEAPTPSMPEVFQPAPRMPTSNPPPSGLGPAAPTSVPEADWKPRLRPKISPLAPRLDSNPAGEAPGPPESPDRSVPPAPGRPEAGEWKPRLGAIAPQGQPPEPVSLAGRSTAPSGPKVPIPLPVADQLLPGEWIVATFTDLTATTEDSDRRADASVAVTNRRLLLLTPSGTPVEAWPLQAVAVEASPGGGRARLVGGIDLEFTSPELAAGFSEAMTNASGLLPTPPKDVR